MGRHWIAIIGVTAWASATTFARSPNPDRSQAEELYRRTEYGRAIDALQVLDARDAGGHALLGKAYFMEGRYKEAAANLDVAVGEDRLNS